MQPADNPAPTAQLGCGTLILIALIVMIFSGRGEERKLKRSIERLEKKIDACQGQLQPQQHPHPLLPPPSPAPPRP